MSPLLPQPIGLSLVLGLGGFLDPVCLSLYGREQERNLSKRMREMGSKSVLICIGLGVFVCRCSGAPGTQIPVILLL